MIDQAGLQAGGHPFIRPGQVAPDRPPPDACMQCGQPEAEHPLDPRPLTCDAAESAYRGNLHGAADRYAALSIRDLSAGAAALLRERGEFDVANLGHRALAEREPLTTDDRLEQLAIGEMLARYYRHPSMLDRAAKAGAAWEQIGAARGTTADQARQDYRDWAVGQHNLNVHYGKWGLDDDEYAAAIARAGQDGARHAVTFDLMADKDTDFVLTEALREFAARQRSEADDEDPGSPIAHDRIRWAECAESALRDRGGVMSGNQQYAQTLARHVKAALMHLRQAEDLAELAGVDIYASEHGVPASGLIRAAGEAVEHLDLWAINNARANGAAPTETYAHTERWCHAESGSLPAGSWSRPPAADLADSEGLRQLSAYLEEADETARAERRAELASLRRAREAWEETARACVCPPGLCSRRDHAGEADPSGCIVCAELDQGQPCYAAVLRSLAARGGTL